MGLARSGTVDRTVMDRGIDFSDVDLGSQVTFLDAIRGINVPASSTGRYLMREFFDTHPQFRCLKPSDDFPSILDDFERKARAFTVEYMAQERALARRGYFRDRINLSDVPQSNIDIAMGAMNGLKLPSGVARTYMLREFFDKYPEFASHPSGCAGATPQETWDNFWRQTDSFERKARAHAIAYAREERSYR